MNKYTNLYLRYHKAIEKWKNKTTIHNNKENLKNKFNNKNLLEWQKKITTHLEKQDDRKITWVVDSKGNNGKSYLSTHLHINHNAFLADTTCKKDIAYAYNYEKVVVFDLPREFQEINYSTLEAFKNGRIFSSKYESNLKVFEPCKVIVFSNWLPNTQGTLSEDRFDIFILENKIITQGVG